MIASLYEKHTNSNLASLNHHHHLLLLLTTANQCARTHIDRRDEHFKFISPDYNVRDLRISNYIAIYTHDDLQILLDFGPDGVLYVCTTSLIKTKAT